jgi:hypothetical protein
MISFIFRVNKSFLEYSAHPITVPNSKTKLLIKEIYGGMGERNQEIKILPPGSRRILDGHIYYGVTNDHPYYQIKVLGSYPSDYFGHLKIGKSLLVKIEKQDNIIQVSMVSSENRTVEKEWPAETQKGSFVVRRRAKVDPVQAYLNEFQAATPEKQKEMLAELQRRAAGK